MSDKEITKLTSLTVADSNDLLVIVDISELDIDKRTKKITKADLMSSPGAIGDVNASTGDFTSLTADDLTLFAGSTIIEFSIDGTLSGNSDSTVPTEKAVKTYVDAAIAGLDQTKIYEGNSSIQVIDDSTAAGQVDIIVDGSLVGQWTTSGLTLTSGSTINEFSTDGTLAGNSDDVVPTEKAVKTYVDNAIDVKTGSVSLFTGDATALIIFDSTESGTTYRIGVELVNNVDALSSVYKWTIVNKTISGFDVCFSGQMDSDNYDLEWFIIV